MEFFKAIMERGTITEAAKALRVSQPAVSKALRTLEGEMGLKLFERTQSGLMPTFEARTFYKEVVRSFIGLEILSGIGRELHELKHGRLVVGVIPALATGWMPKVVASFLQQFPNANLTLETISSPDIAQMVGQGRLDIGVAQATTNDVSIRRTDLFSVDTVCVMPRDHPLARKDYVTPQDLTDVYLISLSRPDIIRKQVEALLAENGIHLATRLEVTVGSALCKLVSEGIGIGLVDLETAMNFTSGMIEMKRFEPRIKMPISMLQSLRRPESELERRFTIFLKESAPLSIRRPRNC
ncbi:LysR substrate-binding domain-containing protein [Microvirga sp. P5_D2]